MRVVLAVVLVSFAVVPFVACGNSTTTTPGQDGGSVINTDCPSGLPAKMVNGVNMCIRTPTQEALAYDEGNDTTTCGDTVSIDMSCHTTQRIAPAAPATVVLEGFIDTFGLEKSTTGITVEIRTKTGTVLGSTLGDANHRCSRTKTAGNKTSTLVGYTLEVAAGVPTNQLLVFKNSGSGFKNTYVFGKHFSTLDCVNAPTISDNECHTGCFIRGGKYVIRYDTNVISDATWNLIPLTAGYSQGIRAGNAALAGQLHDCKDNQLRNAGVAFSPSARAKVQTYFNGNCEDPTPNNSIPFSNKDSLYALLDATPGPIQVSGEALIGGALKNLGLFDIELFANSVSLLTLGPPVPVVGNVVVDGGSTPADGGTDGGL